MLLLISDVFVGFIIETLSSRWISVTVVFYFSSVFVKVKWRHGLWVFCSFYYYWCGELDTGLANLFVVGRLWNSSDKSRHIFFWHICDKKSKIIWRSCPSFPQPSPRIKHPRKAGIQRMRLSARRGCLVQTMRMARSYFHVAESGVFSTMCLYPAAAC